MEPLYLPTLHYFENGNRFSGSYGLLRFMLNPEVVMKNPKEVDLEASSVEAQLWHGQFCLEKSTVEKTQTFPMSPEGVEQLRAWLYENA